MWPTPFVTHECSRHHITISSPVDKIVVNFSVVLCQLDL